MIVKLVKDHVIKMSPTCGEMHDILAEKDDPHVNIAVAFNIRNTQAHYHLSFEEIYFVLEGTIQLKLYDPTQDKVWVQELAANELIVLAPGVHHGIVQASEKNRLCVITVPGFDPEDEHLSDKI